MEHGNIVRILTTLLMVCCCSLVVAQDNHITKPLPFREVSGKIIDSTGNAILGALVTLHSVSDSIICITDEDGIFIIKNVKSAIFTLTISALGKLNHVQKHFVSDTQPHIVLAPIIVKNSSISLNEVEITGKIGIRYKTDTVEFVASDYKVRDYASLRELIKKIEGFKVGQDGVINYNGEEIKRARFNGVDYFGGDVKGMLNELPANILEKIQVIDDYGKEAAMTGVKTGTPEKLLNVVTKADKSAGLLANIDGKLSDVAMLNLVASLKSIDGIKQRGLAFDYSKQPVGLVQEGFVPPYSGGDLKRINLSLTEQGSITKKTKYQIGYQFNDMKRNSLQDSKTIEFYDKGTQNSLRYSEQQQGTKEHVLNGIVSYDSDRHSLSIVPKIVYKLGSWNNNINTTQNGFLNYTQKSLSELADKTTTFAINSTYIYKTDTKGSSISMRLQGSKNFNKSDLNNSNNFAYFNASNLTLTLDSMLNISSNTKYDESNYLASFSFNKKISKKALFTVALSRHTVNRSRDFNVFDQYDKVDTLSGTFRYIINENPLSLIYSLNLKKYEFLISTRGMLTTVKSSAIANEADERINFNLLPEVKLTYRPNMQTKVSLGYLANTIQPNMEQVIPLADISNPNYILRGNPALRQALEHQINAKYSNYLARFRLNLLVDASATFTKNKVIANYLFFGGTNGFRREAEFLNADGDYGFRSSYNLTKTFNESKYTVSLNGNLNWQQVVNLSDNILFKNRNLILNNNITLRGNFAQWIEGKLWVGQLSNRFFYANTAKAFSSQRYSITYESKIFFSDTFDLSFSLEKAFTKTAIESTNRNPFLIDFFISKRIFQTKNAVIGIGGYDLLKQNNLIKTVVGGNSITDIVTDTKSRYFVISFSFSPQKWMPGKNAKNPRKGDGSFTP
jgi:hypothetical protein